MRAGSAVLLAAVCLLAALAAAQAQPLTSVIPAETTLAGTAFSGAALWAPATAASSTWAYFVCTGNQLYKIPYESAANAILPTAFSTEACDGGVAVSAAGLFYAPAAANSAIKKITDITVASGAAAGTVVATVANGGTITSLAADGAGSVFWTQATANAGAYLSVANAPVAITGAGAATATGVAVSVVSGTNAATELILTNGAALTVQRVVITGATGAATDLAVATTGSIAAAKVTITTPANADNVGFVALLSTATNVWAASAARTTAGTAPTVTALTAGTPNVAGTTLTAAVWETKYKLITLFSSTAATGITKASSSAIVLTTESRVVTGAAVSIVVKADRAILRAAPTGLTPNVYTTGTTAAGTASLAWGAGTDIAVIVFTPAADTVATTTAANIAVTPAAAFSQFSYGGAATPVVVAAAAAFTIQATGTQGAYKQVTTPDPASPQVATNVWANDAGIIFFTEGRVIKSVAVDGSGGATVCAAPATGSGNFVGLTGASSSSTLLFAIDATTIYRCTGAGAASAAYTGATAPADTTFTAIATSQGASGFLFLAATKTADPKTTTIHSVPLTGADAAAAVVSANLLASGALLSKVSYLASNRAGSMLYAVGSTAVADAVQVVSITLTLGTSSVPVAATATVAYTTPLAATFVPKYIVADWNDAANTVYVYGADNTLWAYGTARTQIGGTFATPLMGLALRPSNSLYGIVSAGTTMTPITYIAAIVTKTGTFAVAGSIIQSKVIVNTPGSANPRLLTLVDGMPSKAVGGLTVQAITCTAVAGVTAGALTPAAFAASAVSTPLAITGTATAAGTIPCFATTATNPAGNDGFRFTAIAITTATTANTFTVTDKLTAVAVPTETTPYFNTLFTLDTNAITVEIPYPSDVDKSPVVLNAACVGTGTSTGTITETSNNCVIASTRTFLFTAGANPGTVTCTWTFSGPAAGLYASMATTVFTVVPRFTPFVAALTAITVTPPALAAPQSVEVGSSWYKLDFTIAAAPVGGVLTIATECSSLGDNTAAVSFTTSATNFAIVGSGPTHSATVTFTAGAFTGNARCVFKPSGAAAGNYAAIAPAAFFRIVSKIALTATGVPAAGNVIAGGDIATRLPRTATSVTVAVPQPTAGLTGNVDDNKITLTLDCTSRRTGFAPTYTPANKQTVLTSATTTNTIVVTWPALGADPAVGMNIKCDWAMSATGTGTKFSGLPSFTFFVGDAVTLTATPAAAGETTRRVTETSVVTVAAAGAATAPVTGGITITATCTGVGFTTFVGTINVAAAAVVTGTYTFTAPSTALTTLTVTCAYTVSGAGLEFQGYFAVPAPTVFTITPQAAVTPRGIPAAADVIVPVLATIVPSTTTVNVIVPRPTPTLAAGQTLIVGLTGCTANNVAATSGADVTFDSTTTADATIAITLPAAVADTGIIVKCTFKGLTGTAAPFFYSTLSTFQFVVAQRHAITAVAQNTGHYFAGAEKTDILFTAPTTAGGVGTFAVTVTTVCTPCVNINNNLFTKQPTINNNNAALTNAARTGTTSVSGTAAGTTVCSFTLSGADSNLFTKPADVSIVTWPVAQITTTGAGITGPLAAFTLTPVPRATTSSVLTLAVPAGTPVNVADEYALQLTCAGATVAPAAAAPFLAGAALPTFTLTWTSPATAADAPLLVSCTWTVTGSKQLRYVQPAAFSFIVGDPLTITAAVAPASAVVGAVAPAIPVITVTPPTATTTATTGTVTISMSCTRATGANYDRAFTWPAGAAMAALTQNFPVGATDVGTYTCGFTQVRTTGTTTDDRRFVATTSTFTVTITPAAVDPTVQLTTTGGASIAPDAGTDLVFTVNPGTIPAAEGFSLALACGSLSAGAAKVYTPAAPSQTFTISFPTIANVASGRTYRCTYTLTAPTPAAKWLKPIDFIVRQGVAGSFTTTVAASSTTTFGAATTFTATIKPTLLCLPLTAVFGVTCTVPTGTAAGARPNVKFAGQATVNNQLSATSDTINPAGTTGTTAVGTVVIEFRTIATTPIGDYVCTPTINSVGENFYFNNPPAFTITVAAPVVPPTFTITYPAAISRAAATAITVSVTEAPRLGGVWAKVTCGGNTAGARFLYFFETVIPATNAQTFTFTSADVQYGTSSCVVDTVGYQPAAPIATQWTESRFVNLAAVTQTWGIRPVITATAGVTEGVITVPACASTTVTLSTTATEPNTVALSCTGAAGYATISAAVDNFKTGTTATFTVIGNGIGSSFTCTPSITGGAGSLYDTLPTYTTVVGTPTAFTSTGNPAFTTTGTTRTVSVSLAALPTLVTSVTLGLTCSDANVVPANRVFTGAATQTFAITATTAGVKNCVYTIVTANPATDVGRFRVPTAFSFIVGTLRTFTVNAFTQIQIGTSATATVIVAGTDPLQQAIVVGVSCTNGLTVSPATATFATGAPVAATFTFTAPGAAGTSVCTVSSASESVAPAATQTFNVAIITTPVNPSSSGSVDPCAGGICAAFAAASRPSVILYIAALIAAFVAARQ